MINFGQALVDRIYGPGSDEIELGLGFTGTPNTVEEMCFLLRQLYLELKTGIQRSYPSITTLALTAQDYPIAGPQGARTATVYLHNPNSNAPANGIQGYASGGLGWPEGGGTGMDTSGLAFNAKNTNLNSGYVGAPLRADELMIFDLSHGGTLHVATATVNTVCVAAFYA